MEGEKQYAQIIPAFGRYNRYKGIAKSNAGGEGKYLPGKRARLKLGHPEVSRLGGLAGNPPLGQDIIALTQGTKKNVQRWLQAFRGPFFVPGCFDSQRIISRLASSCRLPRPLDPRGGRPLQRPDRVSERSTGSLGSPPRRMP